MNTLQVLVASLLVTGIVALLGYSVISTLHHNPPMEAPVDITTGVLTVGCSKSLMNVGSLRYEVLDSTHSTIRIGARNAAERTITIDAVAPKLPKVTIIQLPKPITLPPRGEAYTEVMVPWINLTTIVGMVKPGDVYVVDGASLVRLESGPYFEYFGGIPVNDPPSQYTPPFKGSVRHQLQVSGTLMSAYISQPGYAATQLLENASRADLFVLMHVKPERWVEETDIVYFVDFYPGAQAMYATASKTVGFISGGSGAWSTDEVYIGVHLESSRTSLYLQNNTSPRITARPAIRSRVGVIVGVAREKEVKSRLGFVAYRYSDSAYHVVVFDYKTGDYIFFDSSSPGSQSSGRGIIFSNVDSITVSQGQYGTAPILIVYNPTGARADWVFTLNTYEGTFRYYLQPLDSDVPIVNDFLVLWGDQSNPVTGSADDDWMDHVVRITIFSDGASRIAVMAAKGGYQHDFYVVVDSVYPLVGGRVYTKPYGAYWYHSANGSYLEIPDKVYYPSTSIAPGYVSSHVYYIGAFRSPTLTVRELFPGDVVTLVAQSRAVSYVANGSVLSVNLLTAFGPAELVEALKAGGIVVIINPSAERAMSLLPSEALVHVKGDWVDAWVPVRLLLVSKCTMSATGGSGTISLERRGDFIRVTIVDDRTGSSVKFGAYASVELSLSDFTILVRHRRGVETISPGRVKDGVEISPRIRLMVYSDRALLITDSGIVELREYSSIWVTVSGSFELRGLFGR